VASGVTPAIDLYHHNQRKLNDPPVLGVCFAMRILHLTSVYPELSRWVSINVAMAKEGNLHHQPVRRRAMATMAAGRVGRTVQYLCPDGRAPHEARRQPRHRDEQEQQPFGAGPGQPARAVHQGSCIDLSRAAANAIGMGGIARVTVQLFRTILRLSGLVGGLFGNDDTSPWVCVKVHFLAV
jgi:hypothetical protein